MMPIPDAEHWKGLRNSARDALEQRDYGVRLPGAGDIAGNEEIPGVMVFPRTVYPQHNRGFFGELARMDEPPLSDLGLKPVQWSSACMFGGTAKGFHVHPPYIPEGTDPAAWFRKLYVEEKEDMTIRPYDREQWDVMFFIRGLVELILVDERIGMPREVMQFHVDGDDRGGGKSHGVVIPAGVAHAMRSASAQDVVMVYGTSMVFNPDAEGRIASSVERAALPAQWSDYLAADGD
jgi:dTDP-4-dehydrorhamnose 3,5-epimerase-like enzyme